MPPVDVLPDAAMAQLERFRELVLAEPQSLVSLADRTRLSAHVDDSLAALGLLDRLGVRTLVDLGSGGGFPAIPLAIARPEVEATLMESIGWKARFLAATSTHLNLESRVSVQCLRAEEAPATLGRERFDLGTARAVAPPVVVAELLAPLVRPGGHLLLWTTGAVLAAHDPGELPELGLARPTAHAAPSHLRDDAVLLAWPRVGPCEDRFPRRVGVATKRPLRKLPAT